MGNQVMLHDGRVLGEKQFSINDSEYRRLNLADKLAIRLAEEECARAPRYSVVIASRVEVLATALGCTDGRDACVQAYENLEVRREAKDVFLPKLSLAAAINFVPVSNEVDILKRGGVDVLFLAKGFFDAEWPGAFLKSWIGPYLGFDGKKRMRRGVWVSPHWSRMDKINRKLEEQ